MLRKLSFFVATLSVLISSFHLVHAEANRWDLGNTYEVDQPVLNVYEKPDMDAEIEFVLYKGMDVRPAESMIVAGDLWFRLTESSEWIIAVHEGVTNLKIKEADDPLIEDYYGILSQPHHFAVKMVKLPGAKGYMEIYEKTGAGYRIKNLYPITYRKEGIKTKFGDLKTIGGNGIRYLYRTRRSMMNGWDASGEPFGVYKVSYPMPHDAYPQLLSGRLSAYEYNQIPAINRHDNGEYYPHPEGKLGANIVLHTAAKGSAGCINIENEAMSVLYHRDMVTENNKEIIPLIIYDEDRVAPPLGQLL